MTNICFTGLAGAVNAWDKYLIFTDSKISSRLEQLLVFELQSQW